MNNNRNNNNNNNNRRRGRGNRKQGGGGGNQANRIDSRARGNAPQLLDKYKKLAEDAHRNGDRVQGEYYLQFADHYFRVIADNKARQDEQRGPRRGDDQVDDEDEDDFEEQAEARPEQRRRRNRDDRDDRDERDSGQDTRGEARETGEADFEPAGNPFVRRDEAPRTRKPRARRDAAEAPSGEIDHAVLPPSIGRRAENDSGDDAVAEAKPPRRRRRKADEDSAVAAE